MDSNSIQVPWGSISHYHYFTFSHLTGTVRASRLVFTEATIHSETHPPTTQKEMEFIVELFLFATKVLKRLESRDTGGRPAVSEQLVCGYLCETLSPGQIVRQTAWFALVTMETHWL